MKIVIDSEPFDPWKILDEHQKEIAALEGQYGATAVFVGTMRDFNEGDNVSEMFLEHYP
ncbi:MAG: molybdenum cofactor biosynthesis protein MoaE, partial [Thiotrichaceae bacterium]|nr:molybdenum cofactor biosynthesis protein MoaE [Thiotrichaceae bacterium]